MENEAWNFNKERLLEREKQFHKQERLFKEKGRAYIKLDIFSEGEEATNNEKGVFEKMSSEVHESKKEIFYLSEENAKNKQKNKSIFNKIIDKLAD